MEIPVLDLFSWTNLQSQATTLLGEGHLSAAYSGKLDFF